MALNTRLFFIVFLIILTSCTPSYQQKSVVTSGDDPGPPGSIHNLPRGCYVMKKIVADEFECFGCVDDDCKDEDLKVWDYYDQDVAKEQGYSCAATSDGCMLR